MRRLIVQPPAQRDERLILSRSRRLFGADAAYAYAALLRHAYRRLRENPDRDGVQQREDLSGAPYLFQLRHARTRGMAPKLPRHFVVFSHDDTTLTVLRVLHDSMDITQRLSGESE